MQILSPEACARREKIIQHIIHLHDLPACPLCHSSPLHSFCCWEVGYGEEGGKRQAEGYPGRIPPPPIPPPVRGRKLEWVEEMAKPVTHHGRMQVRGQRTVVSEFALLPVHQAGMKLFCDMALLGTGISCTQYYPKQNDFFREVLSECIH